MRRIAFCCNFFWLLLSLFTCVEAYRFRLYTTNKPGPGLFPFCAGFFMLILSLVALFQLMGKNRVAEKTIPQEPIRWWNIVIITGTIIAYAFSLEKIGFLINSFIFICLLLKVVEPQPWKTAILGGLITAIAANVVFNVILRAQIPTGILGF